MRHLAVLMLLLTGLVSKVAAQPFYAQQDDFSFNQISNYSFHKLSEEIYEEIMGPYDGIDWYIIHESTTLAEEYPVDGPEIAPSEYEFSDRLVAGVMCLVALSGTLLAIYFFMRSID